MTDEEKKAIIELKHYCNLTQYWKNIEYTKPEFDDYVKTILNLIKKQQKEIEELKEENNTTIVLEANRRNYNRVYNLGKIYTNKKWEDKIKAKIEEAKKSYNDLHTKHLRDCGIAEQRELAKIEFGQ